ncbi:ribonuclease toxin immunity protein CdiI [Priestia megaterium]|uniref:ribonuclease toxin immunity protein CdiI n=1 Tax=Priestia megaterium TaxID=1404 RepID=UPI0013E2C914|nr:ribonuclease toxin immunity protein CdiI [Priestia megaterium]MED3866699.1 ribonuclease toxin immunity protein CdiI [Priestia megaterium]MED4100937.1 ribonuclease toxin immunity protein CdiI [Priestia megaterium]MED4146234.1 ribonuclease toxin immunity protein CdiI [Priestia megaterium]MED4169801.1 ribonuclease toxin immunity protein CdiI [Priestia megaterium]MED4201711.1 ribonuclease toxin immunity protein CdiI [Priestia megaterium]
MSTVFDDKNKLIRMYEEQGLHKGSVIDVLGDFVMEYDFVRILEGFLEEYVERRDYMGVVYSDEFDRDDEEFFGENRVLFYYGVDEEIEDIVDYEELCKYLQTACQFYIEKHPERTENVKELLFKIKDKYNII